MTVDQLIRDLSELSPIDRTLEVRGVVSVTVFPGRCVTLTDKSAQYERDRLRRTYIPKAPA